MCDNVNTQGLKNFIAEFNAGWSSSVARRAHNPEVVGSNPAPATKQRENIEISMFFLFVFII